MDISDKPWRGHLSGNADSVASFFNKEEGYNNFILHYARLVKDYVDAFIIGSELIGLTKIKDQDNNFPAVIELVNLAKLVKNIVGSNVLVTYAADWSEYHHTTGGWYNMDQPVCFRIYRFYRY
ncbi:MAG: glycoside hydrolase TIM-barrel-like domain-containing protein [Candidatus Rickettsia vulgarisii]